jgi:hypothetical protein
LIDKGLFMLYIMCKKELKWHIFIFDGSGKSLL